MAKHEIVAAKIIQVAPEDIYAIIADYHTRHPRILPKPYFASLVSTGATTTFTVEKHTGEQSALVSIGTVIDIRDGILGVIEGWFTTRLLRPIYEKEIEQLEAVVSTSSE